MFFFFKQKTAYEMRISDCSSDVCSSDLPNSVVIRGISPFRPAHPVRAKNDCVRQVSWLPGHCSCPAFPDDIQWHEGPELAGHSCGGSAGSRTRIHFRLPFSSPFGERSEEHTSELQSLMRISYAVFCLKTKKNNK